jgi:hypothetical protein
LLWRWLAFPPSLHWLVSCGVHRPWCSKGSRFCELLRRRASQLPANGPWLVWQLPGRSCGRQRSGAPGALDLWKLPAEAPGCTRSTFHSRVWAGPACLPFRRHTLGLQSFTMAAEVFWSLPQKIESKANNAFPGVIFGVKRVNAKHHLLRSVFKLSSQRVHF